MRHRHASRYSLRTGKRFFERLASPGEELPQCQPETDHKQGNIETHNHPGDAGGGAEKIFANSAADVEHGVDHGRDDQQPNQWYRELTSMPEGDDRGERQEHSTNITDNDLIGTRIRNRK